jgi:hypothetical protein
VFPARNRAHVELPSPADKPPSGANWIHEIKHAGFPFMARRDPVGIRLITPRGERLEDPADQGRICREWLPSDTC